MSHYHSAFATLTFSSPGPWEVRPWHLQAFMKRLRFHYPGALRFFGVGEYGDETMRPHYHVALFGLAWWEHEWNNDGVVIGGPVHKAWWPWGNVHVGELNQDSAQYIAGYVTKKMTGVDDVRLQGRRPEFARMSLRPGIGAMAIASTSSALMERGAAAGLSAAGDVPRCTKVQGKELPLGRYLRRKLREAVGWTSETPQEVLLRRKQVKSLQSDAQLRVEEQKRRNAAATAAARVKIGKSRRSI